MSTVAEYAAHVERLARELGVTVDDGYAGGRGGVAQFKRATVRIRPVKSAVTYAMALHELGHFGVGSISRKVGRLSEEGAAWRWAMSHALEWTDAMDAKMRKSITSYFRGYDRKYFRGQNIRWPEGDDPVWLLTDYQPRMERDEFKPVVA